MSVEEQIKSVVAEIKGHQPTLDIESKRLRTKDIIAAFDETKASSWCISVVGDSLIRLRLFTEQNFHFIETMGVIAVARYTFELSVWLKLFKLDQNYGLVYHSQLLDTQRKYWKDYRAQLNREISLLKRFQQQEDDAHTEVLTDIAGIIDPDECNTLLSDIRAASDAVDKEAARHFSIYVEQAKFNGYGYQASLVTQKAVPKIDAKIAKIDSEQQAFDLRLTGDVQALIPNRWQWRKMAIEVDLVDEYDFIYTFASKLLHATPASITTNQKNLVLPELLLFLKYINVKLLDVLDLAAEY